MLLSKLIPLYLDGFILYNNFYNVVHSMLYVRVNQLYVGIVLCITSVDQREINLEHCFIMTQRVTNIALCTLWRIKHTIQDFMYTYTL